MDQISAVQRSESFGERDTECDCFIRGKAAVLHLALQRFGSVRRGVDSSSGNVIVGGLHDAVKTAFCFVDSRVKDVDQSSMGSRDRFKISDSRQLAFVGAVV